MTEARYQILFITTATADEAHRIATSLVEEGLAACVNILGACRSIYRWKGEIVDDGETLMIAKIRRENFPAIEERVTALHSYDVPEIIAVDLTNISEPYREFLDGKTNGV